MIYDVAVIGAGVVGAAIARALAQYRLRTLLLEAGTDVGVGTTKANTAILHTGFDAKAGTLEARLVRRGHGLLAEYGARVGIAIEPLGALLVAWNEEQLAALPAIAANAERNGYTDARQMPVGELYRLEPHLGAGALGALAVPDEAIICPFTPPLAFATEAVLNGVELALETPVTGVRVAGDASMPAVTVSADGANDDPAASADGADAAPAAARTPDDAHELATPRGTFRARWVVNAAGLHADVIDRWFGHDGFTVTPRRGELIVYDKLARPLVRHVLLPVPTSVSKGVLVSPTVFGNVVLGPTAEDVRDKHASGSTAAGLQQLVAKGRAIVPALVEEEVTAVYVGLRAATEHADYQIAFHPGERYVCVGGIRSTGLSASMAIAEHVLEGLADAGLVLAPRDDHREVRMPNVGECAPRPYQRPDAIVANPDYGRIVCHCERVTRGEILDAAAAPIPARTLDGLRRRTRALLGRCQGFYCLAEVTRLLAAASGRAPAEILGVAAARDDTGAAAADRGSAE